MTDWVGRTQVYGWILVRMIGVMHISLHINKSYFHTNEYKVLYTLINIRTQMYVPTLIDIHYKQTGNWY